MSRSVGVFRRVLCSSLVLFPRLGLGLGLGLGLSISVPCPSGASRLVPPRIPSEATRSAVAVACFATNTGTARTHKKKTLATSRKRLASFSSSSRAIARARSPARKSALGKATKAKKAALALKKTKKTQLKAVKGKAAAKKSPLPMKAKATATATAKAKKSSSKRAPPAVASKAKAAAAAAKAKVAKAKAKGANAKAKGAKPKPTSRGKEPTAVAAKSRKGAKLRRKAASLKKPTAKKEMRFSAYQLFQKEMSSKISAASLEEKSKALAKEWKGLSEAKRATYISRASGDEGLRKRRLSAYALFVKKNFDANAPLGDSMKKLATEWKAFPEEKRREYQERANRGEGSKIRMQKSKTPKALSAYTLFTKENFQKVRDADGGKGSLANQMKTLAQRWKSLPAAEQEEYRMRALKAAPVEPKKRKISGYTVFVAEKLRLAKPITPDTMKQAALEWKGMPEAQKNEYNLKAKRNER